MGPQLFVARDLAPGDDLDSLEPVGAALRGKVEGAQTLDGISEEFGPNGRRSGRGPQIDDPATDRELAGGGDDIGAPVAQAMQTFGKLVEIELGAGRQFKGKRGEGSGWHHVLTQRRHRSNRNDRFAPGEIGEERHARAALRRAADRADALLARSHERGNAFAQVIRQVRERALGDVGARHDDEHRRFERLVDPRQQIRARAVARLFQRERGAVRAQPIDQQSERTARCRKRANERGRERRRGGRRNRRSRRRPGQGSGDIRRPRETTRACNFDAPPQVSFPLAG